MSELRLRPAARALVVQEADRVLLVRHGSGPTAIWVTPGGGVEQGESDEEALRRELYEETGLEDFRLGPLVWIRTAHVPLGGGRWDGEVERIYLVRAPRFEPAPRIPWARLRAEGLTAMRWWELEELEGSGALFAPRSLPMLVRELIRHGPPAEPLEVGF
ncbi:MAG TPA: NUDIX domain-containing protein [Gaiellaceae bacterium]|nr:NUDIX domain-containing protein [Gaiellaceae bacterium]